MHPREYLGKCKEDCTRRTRCHPRQEGVQRAVMEGVPEGVQAAILNNPDLLGADSHVWDRHVIHHLQQAKDEAGKEESDIKELQTQLLKLQVGEAKQKANKNKKRGAGKQMVAEATTGGPPPQPMPGQWGGTYLGPPCQYSGEAQDRGEADSMLSLMVMDKELPFLVDTGATYSTLNIVPKGDQVSTSTVTVVGFSGEDLPVRKPVKVSIGKQTFLHPFVISPTVPVNLLGRDVLVKLGAFILCSADGLVVTLPEGTRLQCGTQYQGSGQWLMRPVRPRAADIYWGLLEPGYGGILGAYSMWRPWISLLEPCVSPPDPLHKSSQRFRPHGQKSTGK
ncbi:uncharacterized protein LOC125739878 [Brienomyrus brachyistius]|uniref:uncharacterized protein LOC125739878 n=1 Tax=Brienomyrus brachyistius TaxID=42636 RepID=UPI0020B3ECF4|nr:uncharacterized protein LOC125739878 [Brienomyrus brachyistius]